MTIEQEKVTIFIALSNQVLWGKEILENKTYVSEDHKQLVETLITSSLALLDKYTPEEPLPKTIPRPTF